jgi:hypothetical protein
MSHKSLIKQTVSMHILWAPIARLAAAQAEINKIK